MWSKTQKVKDAETGSVRKRTFFGLSIGTLIVLFLITRQSAQAPSTQTQGTPNTQTNVSQSVGRIGEGYFNFEIADTNEERTLGLSGREPLPDSDALLFVFEAPGKHCFWMKDMKFAIDILWFDEGKKLVYEKRGVSPSTYPESFCPDVPTKYVVEVTAGVAPKNQIKPGDNLDIEL